MDIRLFLAVIRRFKKLVIGGVILAILLAILSYGTPRMVNGKPGVIPRGTETWQSQAEIMITQGSDPYGRAAQQFTGGSAKMPATPVGDQSYMSGLAPIYAALANGDAIRNRVAQADHLPGTFTATEVIDTATSAPLPFIEMTATAPTETDAVTLAERASKVLENYVAAQQQAAGIAPADRVLLQMVQNGRPATLVKGHSTTIPMLVFVAVLAASIWLAFLKENADPKTAAKLGRTPKKEADDFTPVPQPVGPMIANVTPMAHAVAAVSRAEYSNGSGSLATRETTAATNGQASHSTPEPRPVLQEPTWLDTLEAEEPWAADAEQGTNDPQDQAQGAARPLRRDLRWHRSHNSDS